MAEPDDFDPTHALDGWRVPAPAPLDLDLRALHATRSSPAASSADAGKQAWLKRHGFEMTDVEDVEVRERPPAAPANVEVPVVALRVEPPPPAPDPQAVIADVVLPAVAPAPVETEPPALDMPPAPPGPDPRLLAQWQPDAWLGLTYQVSGAGAEVRQTAEGVQVEHQAAAWLCAAWAPQGEPAARGRWPAFAALVEGERAAEAWTSLLPELPAGAPVWLSPDAADWALVAELLLHQQPGLRPSQARRLNELVEAERLARRAHIEQGYTQAGRVTRQCA